MQGKGLRVVVVGGGIMGASAAWHLARAGADVTLLERLDQPAGGATGWSYGWIGTSSALPSEHLPRFALKMAAVADYARLATELGPLPIAARGALVWLDSEEETLELIAQQQAAGVRMEALARRHIAGLEPHLAAPPSLAAWAPDDFSVEPADLTRQLLASAREAGARIICAANVEAIQTQGDRVTGVRVNAQRIPADVVILANAAAAGSLAAALGVVLPIHEEPALLMRMAAQPGIVGHLLCGRDVELRQTLCGDLLSAMDCPPNAERNLADVAEQAIARIREMFAGSPPLSLLAIAAAPRPMNNDGLPLRMFLPTVAGLYALVAHPGVILAPYLGRLTAEEVMTRFA